MILHTIWLFVSAHWHKIVAVAAFFLAVYNRSKTKLSHNDLLDKITKLEGMLTNKKKTSTKPSSKKHKKSQSK